MASEHGPGIMRVSKLITGYLSKKAKLLISILVPRKYRIRIPSLYVRYLESRYFLLSFLYSGSEFECPFCGGHFRRLLPCGLKVPVLEEKRVVGAGYNPNCMCPRCHSIDRYRHVYLYLRNKTNLFDKKNLKVLHVAPEIQLNRVLRSCPNIDYVTADLKSPFVMVKMDVTNIENKDNWFDVIVCNHVLEHIPDDHKAMSELYRVLKPGGWAILQVPVSLSLDRTLEDSTAVTPEEREKIFGQEDHVRIYARDYKDRLETVGFRVKVDKFEEKDSVSDIRKYALPRDENVYVCFKPER